MGDKGLNKLYRVDLKLAKMALTLPDEVSVNYAAYHVQQFIEKWVKYELNSMGCYYTKQHNMSILLQEAEVCGLGVPEFMVELRFVLDAWATKSRYNSDLLTSKKEVLGVIQKCDDLLKKDIEDSNIF